MRVPKKSLQAIAVRDIITKQIWNGRMFSSVRCHLLINQNYSARTSYVRIHEKANTHICRSIDSCSRTHSKLHLNFCVVAILRQDGRSSRNDFVHFSFSAVVCANGVTHFSWFELWTWWIKDTANSNILKSHKGVWCLSSVIRHSLSEKKEQKK